MSSPQGVSTYLHLFYFTIRLKISFQEEAEEEEEEKAEERGGEAGGQEGEITSRSGFERRKRLVAEGDGNFDVVREGESLGWTATNCRPGKQSHIRYDVPVNHLGVDLVTRHLLEWKTISYHK